MQLTKVFAGAALVLAATAMASPVAQPEQVTQLETRHSKCTSGNATILGEVEGLLEKILPDLKDIFEGLDATEEEIGKAIPVVGGALKLIRELCIA